MPKIFISHSWEDNEVSKKLAEYLERDGAEVWVDYKRLSGGDSLPVVIGEAIEWCDTMALIWSKSAAESYYVKLEWTTALNNEKRIIPCIFDKTKLPTILTGFLYIDFKNFEDGYQKLVRGLGLVVKNKTTETIQRSKQVEEKIGLKKDSKTFTNSLNMTFVYIHPDTFMMGSPDYESGRKNNETLHEVTLTKGFYLQSTPVTQGQWKAVMGNNPSHYKNCGNNCPVESVSWDDAQEFIRRINEKEGKGTYRLPTEAEWEYACRAGSRSRYCFGDDESLLTEYAWYDQNSGDRTHPVGTKKPNAWGLYDMHGNVWEWCEDWYDNYPSGKVTDPTGPSDGSYRVVRGGRWISVARICRSARRSELKPDDRGPNVGFRVILLRP